METSDQTLLAAAQAGDPKALEEIIQRHQRTVYRFGLRMCRDPEDAKDVLQETLLAVARTVRDFRGASSVSTWLYTIAPVEEASLDSRSSGAEARQVADPGRPPDESLAGRQVEAALEQAIRAL